VSDPRSDHPILFRLSDNLTSEPVAPVATSLLSSNDVYILDAANATKPAIYIWIGKNISRQERRLAIQRGQAYLHKQQAEGRRVKPSVSIVKVMEGEETDGFRRAIQRIQGGM
jgi:gelsolin